MTDRGVSYEGNRPPPRGPAGSGERRVALVIGNGAYTHAEPLANPVRDAEAMAARLTKLGFDVVKGLNLDLRKLGDVQSAFEDKLRGKPDVALLFYAGHGLQVEGRNYLVPIDAEITAKSHLATRALLFNDLLDDMAREANATLIFLDACRDNPFTRNLARSLGDSARFAGVRGGLARIEKVAGTFIAYATAPDQVAFDGKGQNSPFTSALLDHIETPGLSVGDLMIDVRNKVLDETGGRQEPWDQSSLRARFYFVPPEPEPERPVSEAASEWAAIQGTTSLAVLAAFQERHPDPPWSTYAEARANELRAADAARKAADETERAEADRRRSDQDLNSEAERHRREQAAERARKEKPRPVRPAASQSTSLALPLLGGAATVAVIAGLMIARPWETQPAPTPAVTPERDAALEKPAAPAPPTPAPAPVRPPVAATGPKPGETFRDCTDCPEMVVVPAGSFTMGSPDREEGRDSDEGPQRRVTIANPFAVGKFEVTFAEWDACVASGGCSHKPEDEGWGRGKRPAINVSWDDAKQYVAWLSKKTGQPYRLLTEAEWEYAARAGTTARFSFGNEDKRLCEFGNVADQTSKEKNPGWTIAECRDGFLNTAPVGTFKPNAIGLHDMHGNVLEWVEDCYAVSYKGAPTDGSKAPDTKGCSRVLRGGSWSDVPQDLRSAGRDRNQPVFRNSNRGFRLARTLHHTP